MFYNNKNNDKPESDNPYYVEQQVSFIYKHEIRMGTIEKVLTNSAVIQIEDDANSKIVNEKTVINYSKLMPVKKSD